MEFQVFKFIEKQFITEKDDKIRLLHSVILNVYNGRDNSVALIDY